MRQKVINIQAKTLLAPTGGRAPVSEAFDCECESVTF